MKLLLKIEKIIYNIELAIIVILLLSLSVSAFAQVIMRNIFSHSVMWITAYDSVNMLVLALFGASIATSTFERSHINIDLLQGYLPFPYNKYVSAALTLIASAACVWFIFISSHYVKITYNVGKIEEALHTPEWVFVLAFPVCFCSMAFKFFLCFIKDIIDIREKVNSHQGDNGTIKLV